MKPIVFLTLITLGAAFFVDLCTGVYEPYLNGLPHGRYLVIDSSGYLTRIPLDSVPESVENTGKLYLYHAHGSYCLSKKKIEQREIPSTYRAIQAVALQKPGWVIVFNGGDSGLLNWKTKDFIRISDSYPLLNPYPFYYKGSVYDEISVANRSSVEEISRIFYMDWITYLVEDKGSRRFVIKENKLFDKTGNKGTKIVLIRCGWGVTNKWLELRRRPDRQWNYQFGEGSLFTLHGVTDNYNYLLSQIPYDEDNRCLYDAVATAADWTAGYKKKKGKIIPIKYRY